MPLMKQIRKDRRSDQVKLFLKQYSSNVTSQSGEDGILQRVFQLVGEQSRWCVEFGAWDGKKFSNTYNLIANRGWSGVLIEGSEKKYQDLIATYRDNPKAVCLNKIVEPERGPGSLDSHLASSDIPKEFDLLSIDVDGNDYHIWKSVESYRPRVVVIEINPVIPNDILFIQDCSLNVNQGCSLLALIELGKEKGYQLACATPLNGIFVASEHFDSMAIDDNDIDAMFYSSRDAKFFDGYDGTLYHVGMERLHWVGNAPIGPTDLQAIPPERRGFGDAIVRRD